MRDRWQRWRWKKDARPTTPPESDDPLAQARASLEQLLDNPRLPKAVREELSEETRQLERLIEKLNKGQVQIAVFGRVGVGKSALLNALLNRDAFTVSALHGATRESAAQTMARAKDDDVVLIDTPGIDEIDGEAHEAIAWQVAETADLLLFVVSGDMTRSEKAALQLLARQGRPLLLVLNKCDQLDADQQQRLLAALRQQCSGLIAPENVLPASADPLPVSIIYQGADGQRQERRETPEPELDALRDRLWQVLEEDGHALAAINASLFAGEVHHRLATRITALRREVAERVVRGYATAKALSVGANPIPIADLLAAASLDVALVVHLSRIYGLPMGWREAGRLTSTVFAQLAALLGAVWGVNLISSALKVTSLGLSTALTAGAQGLLAWYATYLVGRSAEQYFIRGASWGPGGPNRVVQDLLSQIDRKSLLASARDDIRRRLAGR